MRMCEQDKTRAHAPSGENSQTAQPDTTGQTHPSPSTGTSPVVEPGSQPGHVAYGQTVDDPYGTYDDPYGYNPNAESKPETSGKLETTTTVTSVAKSTAPPPPPPPPPQNPAAHEGTDTGMFQMSF